MQVNIPYNKKALPDEEVAGKTQDKILEILKDNPKATVAMMMAQLSMSDYGIRKKSVLARIRQGIGKYYKIKSVYCI